MLEPYRETSEATLAAIWQLSVRPIRSRSRDDPPAARADPHELLDNALKYTPAGGREEMSAQGEGREWLSTGGGVRKEAGSRSRGQVRMRLRSFAASREELGPTSQRRVQAIWCVP